MDGVQGQGIRVDPLSARSLYLGLFASGNLLSTATGFVVEHSSKRYLITNWHVLSGRRPDTQALLSATGGIPDELRIWHHANNRGSWSIRTELLVDKNGKNLWIEHPLGNQIDVVALPLQNVDQKICLYPFDLALANEDMVPEPAMPVSIIGFPLGLVSDGVFPIWKTGHIASDPDVGYKGKSAFLIDATTREGMSGSPVVMRSSGGYLTKSGGRIIAGSVCTLFLGIYSGRILVQSEIGIVWKPQVISEILNTTK